MSGKFRIFLMAALFAVLPSCKAISSLIHDGEVVARLGDHKLYRSELDDMIPKGTSSLDGQCTLRETTLEDVFVERAGRHLMQR